MCLCVERGGKGSFGEQKNELRQRRCWSNISYPVLYVSANHDVKLGSCGSSDNAQWKEVMVIVHASYLSSFA